MISLTLFPFQLHALYDVELDKMIISVVLVRSLGGGRIIMSKATIAVAIWRGQRLHGYFNDAFFSCIGTASNGRVIMN
jgi:hypothetical protein